MPDTLDRLSAALSDRYAIESELGEGGMARLRGQRRAAEGSGGSYTAYHVRRTTHRP